MKPILELVPESQNQSVFINGYQHSHFSYPWHYHPQWELTFIIKGKGTAYSGNSVRSFIDNELVLHAPNVPHYWHSEQKPGIKVNSAFAQWQDDLLGSNWLQRAEFSSIKTLFNKCECAIAFDNAETFGEQLIKLQYKSPIKRVLGFIDLLHELSIHRDVQSVGQHLPLQTASATDKRVEKILTFADRYYEQKISVDDMANLTNMTNVSFCKYFKRNFQKTFTQFLNELRISKVCSLLLSEGISVEQASLQCGYQNLSFFHRQFKTITGTTPANYRLKYKK